MADAVFNVPAGASFWNANMHEPLVIGVCLPFHRRTPWKIWRCSAILAMERKLCGMWESQDGAERDLLRKLCNLTR